MRGRCLLLLLLSGLVLCAAPGRAGADDAHDDAAPAVPPRLTHPPQLLQGELPPFPEAAHEAGRGGEVVLRLTIDATGAVIRADVVRAAAPELAFAALGAVSHFKFAPARFCVTPRTRVKEGEAPHQTEQCNVPLPVTVEWRTVFQLPDDAPAEAIDHVHNFVGEVFDERSGEALAGVEVSIELPDVDGPHFVTVYTDEAGHFETEVPAGLRRVSVFASGYAPVFFDEPFRDDHITARVLRLKPQGDDAIGGLVVRAERAHFDDDSVRVVEVLEGAALERVRGRGLANAVAELPGVVVLGAGPQVQKIAVRGQFGRRVLTLFDGVRHESQEWGLDHAPEIDPFAAGSLSIVKGAAGVRYGPDAVGGVVLVEPKPLRRDAGVDGELHLIGVDNGLQGTTALRLDAVPRGFEALALRVEANAQKSAAVSAPAYVLGNTGSQVWNVGVTAAYRDTLFDQAVTAQLTLRRHRAALGICYCLNVTTPEGLREQLLAPAPPGSSAWTTSYDLDRPRQEVTHDLLLARATLQLGALGQLSVTYNAQRDLRDEFDTARASVTGPQFSFDLVSQAVDVAFEHARLDVGAGSLAGILGVHGDLQQHNYRGLVLIPSYQRASGGLFAVERLSVPRFGVGDLRLELGARYDQLAQEAVMTDSVYTSLLRRGVVEDGECSLGGDVARCLKLLPAATLSAGAAWAMSFGPLRDALTLSADVSSATRFPDVDELYLGGRAPSLPVYGLGDASLGPETTLNGSLGAAVNVPGVIAEASAFVSRVDDYIAFGPALNAAGAPIVDVTIQGAFPRYTSTAVGALFYGADGGFVLGPGALLSLAGQASWVRGLNLDTGGYLPFVPPPRARAELISNLPRLLFLEDSAVSLNSTAVLRQTRTDAASDFAPPPDGYVLFGAEAHTAVRFDDVVMNVSVEGRNLLNTPTRDAMSLLRYYADQPGREVWLRVRFALE